MANNEDKLNRLYREGLEDFAKDPPPKVWSGVKHRLLIRKLVTFKFMTSLNIYSVATFITIAAIAGFFAGKQIYHNNNLATNNNTASIVKAIPKQNIQEVKETQNSDQQSLNNRIETKNIQPKAEQRKPFEQTENNSISNKQIQHQTSVSTNDLKNSNKIPEQPKTVKETVSIASPQKDNTSKPIETQTEKPLISSNPPKPDQEIQPILTKQPQIEKIKIAESGKQTLQNNITNEKTDSLYEPPKTKTEPVSEIIIPKKPKTTQGFYAEIFGAPTLLSYRFEQSTVNPSLTFVNTTKEDEKPAISYSAGLELGYGLKHVFAQTGINYSDYRSKALFDIINWNSFWETNLVKDSVLIMDSIGNHYQYHYDTIRYLASSDTHIYNKATNSLRYIEIPILIGYRFYGKRMSYAVLMGISLGYLSKSYGKTMNPDLKSITVNTPEAVPFRPWTYYMILRAEAAYLLSKNMGIYIRPGFKYNMNSIFEDYYPVQKSFYSIDLQLGFRYTF